MKNFKFAGVALSALILIALPGSAYAAPAAKKAKAKVEAKKHEAPAETHVLESSHSSGSNSGIDLSVSGPFSLVDGTAMFGVFVTGLVAMPGVENLDVGGESGFHMGSSSGVTFWNIPILATGRYHFKIKDLASLSPFAGLGLGLAINHAGVAAASSTSAVFEMLAHVGTGFADSRLSAILRVGVLDSAFVIAPAIGYSF